MISCKCTDKSLLAYKKYDIEYDENISINLICTWKSDKPKRVYATYQFKDKSDGSTFVQSIVFKHDTELYLDTVGDYMDKHIAFNTKSIDEKVKSYLGRIE